MAIVTIDRREVIGTQLLTVYIICALREQIDIRDGCKECNGLINSDLDEFTLVYITIGPMLNTYVMAVVLKYIGSHQIQLISNIFYTVHNRSMNILGPPTPPPLPLPLRSLLRHSSPCYYASSPRTHG